MTDLTDTQLMILSRASQREDRAAELPATLKGGAARKVVTKLLDRGLLVEVPASGEMPIWRRDDEDRPLALTITGAGLTAIGIAPETSSGEDASWDYDQDPTGGDPDAVEEPPAISPTGNNLGWVPIAPKASKRDLILHMLRQNEGATLDAMVAATGWLPHTTRAALTGLRKKGHVLERSRREADGKTVYRIVSPTMPNQGPEPDGAAPTTDAGEA